jgi:hypothetical protein
LILTVGLPDALQRQADAVRNATAPQAARRAPAHLGLFRHLPGLQRGSLVGTLRSLSAGPAPQFQLLPPAFWNGIWVAPVRSPALDDIRAELAECWHGLLAPGDFAPPRFHISLNKGRYAPSSLSPGPWRATGLLLWQHDRPQQAKAERAGDERDGAFWTPLVGCAFHR